jgi:hypothetical protein
MPHFIAAAELLEAYPIPIGGGNLTLHHRA